jgi:hypothetical protein
MGFFGFLFSFFGTEVVLAQPVVSSQVVDVDQDGVLADDGCPEIPAQTADGCPETLIFPTGLVPGVSVTLLDSAFVLEAPDVLKPGDIVQVALVDPNTDEILAQSTTKQVR